MDKNRINYLINAYQNRQASAEEHEELMQWYREVSYHDGEYPDTEAAVQVRMLARLLDDTGYTPEHVRKRWYARRDIAAAAILMVVFLGVWVFFGDQILDQPTDDQAFAEVTDVQDVAPGGNRATLTLADGRTVDLNEAQSGIVVGDGITYLDGTEVLGSDATERQPTARNLRLTTPEGGTYQVTLSDGTKVWLNAASSLNYPSRFSGGERVVELEGEAYFEVMPVRSGANRQSSTSANLPFRVISKGQTVEVLGTQFNVSAYDDEPETKTTLVEGRVRVGVNGQSSTLKPGQQSATKAGNIAISGVDVSRATAWKDGYFNFTDMTLHEVMRQLGRWYGLEIEYEGQIPYIAFYGSIERNNRLSTVMALLESNDLTYRLDGRKLVVSSKARR
ncbi:FecR family protein [Parapedobacter deserti]|uniref:FecR family protein n=1 Tax=Parapedobacter deserti TaxID=1912957 RepID=A0ABV7JQP9_9SPHI